MNKKKCSISDSRASYDKKKERKELTFPFPPSLTDLLKSVSSTLKQIKLSVFHHYYYFVIISSLPPLIRETDTHPVPLTLYLPYPPFDPNLFYP